MKTRKYLILFKDGVYCLIDFIEQTGTMSKDVEDIIVILRGMEAERTR